MDTRDAELLARAITQARIGLDEGGIPIGAVLATKDAVLGEGRNRRIQLGSPIRHGETDALDRAGRQRSATYRRSTMYTTLSPCDMCTGAILLYGIPRVVVGENRTFLGGESYLASRGVEVVVVQNEECLSMMTSFISSHPELWNEDIGE